MSKAQEQLEDALCAELEANIILQKAEKVLRTAQQACNQARRDAADANHHVRRAQYLADGHCSAFTCDTTGWGDAYSCNNRAKEDGLCGVHLRAKKRKEKTK